jgi:hypothetical protein
MPGGFGIVTDKTGEGRSGRFPLSLRDLEPKNRPPPLENPRAHIGLSPFLTLVFRRLSKNKLRFHSRRHFLG